MFNYLTSSSGFTRITAYVQNLVDGAVDSHIKKLSQNLPPDQDSRGLNQSYELGDLMRRNIF